MRRFLIFILFVLALTVQAEARKLALLVGVDDYDSVRSLQCCVNDSKALKEALLKVGFLESDIRLLVTGGVTREMPTKEKIEQNLEELFAEAGPSDLIFIAFSGHGIQIGEEAWFCPPFVNPKKIEETCVSINKMMEDLAACKAKFKWVVVDACRVTGSETGKSFDGKGLQVIPAPPDGVVLFQSCAAGEESYEDRVNMRGYFTKNLVTALSGDADTNHDGNLMLMEVCSWTISHTRDQVKAEKKESQRPFYSGNAPDFIISQEPNILKAKALAEEAEKAMEEKNYELAVQKFDAALALCPRFTEWVARKRDAERLRDTQDSKYNPVSIKVPDDFASIEEAYAHVKDGGTITIHPGKYELFATIKVDRNVTFRGNSGRAEDVNIDCNGFNAFEITNGSPVFQNLLVSSGGNGCGGFYVTGGTPRFFRCIITSRKGAGIYVKGKNANPKVELCIFQDCAINGLSISDSALGEYRDCEISGSVYPGIVVANAGNPTVTGCKIWNGKNAGIFILDNGRGEFNDCEIYGNALAGIQVNTAANPTFTKCIIHDGNGNGVLVLKNGAGTFRYCTIYRNAYAGVMVKTDGNPTFIGCIICNGSGSGVYVLENGLGVFKDCEIYGNSYQGIQVQSTGNPTVTGCKIHDGKEAGVFVLENGLGEFKDCEIYGNAKSGIRVQTSGNPTVTGCKIHDGKDAGVFVLENGLGKFNDCEIYGNAYSGIQVQTSGNPTVTGCEIHDGKCCGVYVYYNGTGTFNNNTLAGNYWQGKLSNWVIDSNAGEVKGTGNTPSIPSR